ncbi:MAG TPA: NAD(P)/FAD-dependent oxidoreductase [Spirochaetota bacterium]|nr:NAD(P)/FAD-dependent oxidoreductase [Spirochaetota bacterium]HNT09560.1 NAD(P)/FAD-dependent oxidoreductase [Spirochaetota bacterium]HNV45605.1 NAD(P)/FAD-dependent oxidoreductase [Spirochaetota bacterium]HOS40140.1 NAD(P)/FAD-dependent oxidoreductase [Spirochaetota bacterium]HPU87636.1 NAD(P)/FAD-dependent oxidoreductase [Spirochaetota bacterium]
MLEDGDKGVIIQRDKTTYAVAPHIPCGVVSPETLRRLADVAEKYQAAALKLTSAARIAIVGLREEDIDAVWADLGMEPGAGVGLCVRSVKACPGTTFCKRGMQDSLGVGMKLDETFHGMELPSKLKIGVSGCPNQCAETCIKDIGLVGMKNGWRLLVGGNGGGKPRLSQELVRDISEAEAFAAIDRIIAFYKANGARMQRLGALIEKMGFEEFKNAVG